jgi:hypothetical protein
MSTDLKRICLVVPWFGPWPEWTPLFLQSCRFNPTIDWLIPTDQPAPADVPPNVRITTQSLIAYRDRIAAAVGQPLEWLDGYKLCDCKPLTGAIHEAELAGYDYWGISDIDIIYGDIRAFYTPEILTHDSISAHDERVAGHFSLFANTPTMRDAYRRIWCWRDAISDRSARGFDDTHFTRLFLPRSKMRWRDRIRYPHISEGYFQEQFSTDLRPHTWIDGTSEFPSVWSWHNGRLTTNKSGDRQFMYCHFTHWNSARWTGEAYAPWKKLERLVNLPVVPRPESFTISAKGFNPS